MIQRCCTDIKTNINPHWLVDHVWIVLGLVGSYTKLGSIECCPMDHGVLVDLRLARPQQNQEKAIFRIFRCFSLLVVIDQTVTKIYYRGWKKISEKVFQEVGLEVWSSGQTYIVHAIAHGQFCNTECCLPQYYRITPHFALQHRTGRYWTSNWRKALALASCPLKTWFHKNLFHDKLPVACGTTMSMEYHPFVSTSHSTISAPVSRRQWLCLVGPAARGIQVGSYLMVWGCRFTRRYKKGLVTSNRSSDVWSVAWSLIILWRSSWKQLPLGEHVS